MNNITKSLECYYGKAKRIYHNLKVGEQSEVDKHIRNAFYKYRSRQRVRNKEFKTRSKNKSVTITRLS